MSLTPTTRSTPQASLEILYNIPPLDLYLEEQGLITYMRIKHTLRKPTNTDNFSHIIYWDTLMNSHADLLQTNDSCNKTNRNNIFRVNLDSMNGAKKHLTQSEVTAYTDGSKMLEGVGS